MKKPLLPFLLALLCIGAAVVSCEKTTTPTKKSSGASVKGKDLSDTFEITRQPVNRKALLNVKRESAWALFTGPDQDNINLKDSLDYGDGTTGSFDINVPAEFHKVFYIKTLSEATFLAERELPLAGGKNFRDLGGYRTRYNKTVKYGVLFRAGSLSSLTEGDLVYLASIPLRSSIDLRAAGEGGADKFPSTVYEENQHKFPFPATDFNGIYAFVGDPSFAGYIKGIFDILAEGTTAPVVFHGTEGRDRTGIVAALVLLALGVEEETVLADFMLSSPHSGTQMDEAWLGGVLASIRENYGTFDNFFREIGVSFSTMRKLYLY